MEAGYAFGWHPSYPGRFGFGHLEAGHGSSSVYLQYILSRGFDWGVGTTDPGMVTVEWPRYATVGYFPAAGDRGYSTGAPVYVASWAFCWLSSASGYGACYLRSGAAESATSYFDPGRADAFPLRCVQEEVTND